MKERPILFSGPMVRAILEGRKTQTRRVVKPQAVDDHFSFMGKDMQDMKPVWGRAGGSSKPALIKCPYGQVGDRLWVRETWAGGFGTTMRAHNRPYGHPTVLYKADCEEQLAQLEPDERPRFKQSIHMPRNYSRITLEITAVRVERLQDISRKDAAAEGVCLRNEDKPWPEWCRADKWPEENFLRLWDSINGPMSHISNPWVWVIEFRRVA